MGIRAQQAAEQVYFGLPDVVFFLQPLAQVREFGLPEVLEALVRGVSRPAPDSVSSQKVSEGVQQLLLASHLEKVSSGQELVQDTSGGPHIYFWAVVQLLQAQFWRSVPQRRYVACHLPLNRVSSGEAEVCDFEQRRGRKRSVGGVVIAFLTLVDSIYIAILQLALLVFGQLYQKVVGLDVSVETLCRVYALQPQQQLLEQTLLFALGKPGVSLHILFQVCVTELEDEKQIVPIVVHI